MTLTWESIVAGQALPSRVQPMSRMEIIKYAAASGDFYAVHLDPDADESREQGQLIVPGRFKQACLGRLVAEWVGRRGAVRRLACRYVEADPVGKALTFKGEVRSRATLPDRRLVNVRVWTENEKGRVTTLGTATIEWKGP